MKYIQQIIKNNFQVHEPVALKFVCEYVYVASRVSSHLAQMLHVNKVMFTLPANMNSHAWRFPWVIACK